MNKPQTNAAVVLDVNCLAERIAQISVEWSGRCEDSNAFDAETNRLCDDISTAIAPLLAENTHLKDEIECLTNKLALKEAVLNGEVESRILLTAENERRLKLLVECRPYVKKSVNEDEREYNYFPHNEAFRRDFEESSVLLLRIDALTAKGAGQ